MAERPEQDGKYRHIVQAIAETPWALLPSTLAMILDLVSFRAEGGRLAEGEIQERLGAKPSQRQAASVGQTGGRTVAVIPIYGVIMPRATLFSDISGGTSLDRFQAAFKNAVNDSHIDAILLDVDSPGGSSYMVPETAALIREARDIKPVWAIANTLCASAAYYLAAQAAEVVCSPSSLIGSIGVYTAHQDLSGFYEQVGVKYTLISAGKYKTEGNAYAPLDETARAHIQALVDDMYEMFVADVGKGRNASADDVRNGFGEGRVVTAREGVALGMADQVADFDATLEQLLSDPQPAGGRRAAAPAAAAAAATVAVDQAHVRAAVDAALESKAQTQTISELALALRQTTQPPRPPEKETPQR